MKQKKRISNFENANLSLFNKKKTKTKIIIKNKIINIFYI